MNKIIIVISIVLPLFVKAQQCDSLLSYLKSLPNTHEKKYLYLKDLKAMYEEINSKIAINQEGNCSELKKFLVFAIDQKHVEQEFTYYDFALEHAKRLLLSKDSLMAFEYYYKVYGFGLNFSSSGKLHREMADNRERYFDYFIAGGIGMLDCYRYNKKRLEELNPYIFINGELSKYYEEALRQVGLEPKY